jgi:hypothetical protein
MADITSANSVLSLGVASVFTTPQTLQGFGQDDAYSIPSVKVSENMIGVDGIKSSGWLPQLKTMNITLQADSPSIAFFEAWYAAQEAGQSQLGAFGTLDQPSIGRTYVLTNGSLEDYEPIAAAKKVLGPRKFSVVFGMVLGAPTL